jgi:hypothetical protein
MRVPALALSVLMALSLACSGEEEPQAQPERCEIPPEADNVDLVPEDLGLRRFGTITEAGRRGRRLTATLVTETEINLLYPPLARKLLDSGYFMVSSENEGTDAEIFFARGRIAGVYLMKHGRPCGDLVELKLDYVREPR